LIRVEPPIEMNDYINPVCLPRDGQEFEGSLTIAGWGSASEGGEIVPNLMAVDVPIVERKDCETRYKAGDVAPNTICAGFEEGGKDSCRGDSGGPLIQRDGEGRASLVGLVSWSTGCALPGKPGINTQVSHFIQWISKNMHI